MTAASILVRGRTAAERLMVDTCTIRRQSGETMDPVTLQMVPTYTTVYSGKCRVQITAVVGATMPEAGERTVVTQRISVSIPMDAAARVDDQVVMETAAHDADLVGRVYRVRSEFAKTHATARRLECEDTQT